MKILLLGPLLRFPTRSNASGAPATTAGGQLPAHGGSLLPNSSSLLPNSSSLGPGIARPLLQPFRERRLFTRTCLLPPDALSFSHPADSTHQAVLFTSEFSLSRVEPGFLHFQQDSPVMLKHAQVQSIRTQHIPGNVLCNATQPSVPDTSAGLVQIRATSE